MTNAEMDAQVIALDRRRRFILLADLQSSSTKEWLVKGFLGAGEASAMYGKPGDGKSVLAQDLGLHVATGWPWHGRQVKQGAVLYVALERRELVKRRAIAFRLRHSLSDAPFAITGGVYDFRDPRTASYIAEIADEVGEATGFKVELVQIDTLSRALCGGDENSPKDMGAIVNATGILQAHTGAHIMWVHHMPLDGGERMRGHGALLGAMDTTVHVVKSGNLRTATVIKANDSEEGERVAFTLESISTGQGPDDDTTAPVVVPQDTAGANPLSAPSRKLSDRQRLALDALTEATLEAGKPATTSWQLPPTVKVVAQDRWREQLVARQVIEADDTNPRATFKRLREALQARGLVGVRGDLVWRA